MNRYHPTMSIITVLIMGLFTLTLAGCDGFSRPSPPSSGIRLLALGDSYTIGQSVAKEDSFPWQLKQYLVNQGVSIDEPTIIARTGWTTLNLLQAMNRANLNPPYDWVSVLIGVNDQFQGYNSQHYQTQFQKIITRAIALAGQNPKRVIVLSIPDYSVTPFGQMLPSPSTQSELQQFNAINTAIAKRYGVHYVDIVSSSLKAQDDLSLLAYDQLHPSGKMYQLWVEDILTHIKPDQFKKP